eukprot:TRINITY_DN72669_c0_g1_i1.p1 TRINITY_DN72669_c0_g1~~TRINITY_DN72669_c0_g1_i1.p1  ORF type:complete len:158 (+),score=0.58 TRINITY_DN72669_c0_g1_i1:139-612(+)
MSRRSRLQRNRLGLRLSKTTSSFLPGFQQAVGTYAPPLPDLAFSRAASTFLLSLDLLTGTACPDKSPGVAHCEKSGGASLCHATVSSLYWCAARHTACCVHSGNLAEVSVGRSGSVYVVVVSVRCRRRLRAYRVLPPALCTACLVCARRTPVHPVNL